MREAFASNISSNRELLDIYITGAPLGQLLSEVSLAETDVKEKIVIPESHYDLLFSRIIQGFEDNTAEIKAFLAMKGNKYLFSLLMGKNADFLRSLTVNTFRDFLDGAIIFKLHSWGLLPEVERKRYVAVLKELATDVDTPEVAFLEKNYRGILTHDEFIETLVEIKTKLLPNLDRTLDYWEQIYSEEETPTDFFMPLKRTLQSLEKEFKTDPLALGFLNQGFEMIEDAIENLRAESESPSEWDDYELGNSNSNMPITERSIFDDVDED